MHCRISLSKNFKCYLNFFSVKYVVWVSKDQTFLNAKKHETEKRSYPVNELILGDDMYFVAVSVKDAEGLESPRSSAVIIEQRGTCTIFSKIQRKIRCFICLSVLASLPQIMLSTNNALAIVLTVIIVIVILVAVLGIFVVRHKRLQMSFLNFASSHYSTHSGAATFQQNMGN